MLPESEYSQMDYIIFFLIHLWCLSSTISQSSDISISDNCQPNTMVLDLNLLLNIPRSHTRTIYSLSKVYKASKYFEIKNEKIFTKFLIEIDTMCNEIGECCDKNIDFCDLKISIISKSSLNFMTTRIIQVHIKDVNDHIPQFPSPSMDIELSESQKDNNPHVSLPLAVDEDFGRNRIQNYQITNVNPSSFHEFFSLNVRKERSIPVQVDLELRKMLDRETTSRFSFELLAIDGDEIVKKTGSISINIKIRDENDNLPVFQKRIYKEIIKEGFFNNLPIVTLLATDADEGENAKILYQLSKVSSNDFAVNEHFRVELNGKIFLKKALDFERKELYQFAVIATNPTAFTNIAMNPSTASVEIIVENVFDEPLQIIIDYPSVKNWSEIVENSVDVPIAYVTTQSLEAGQKNIGVFCKLQSYENLFELIQKVTEDPSTKSFEIRTKTGIDREEFPRIQTNVLCKESNNVNAQFSEAALVVIIIDVNDNSPELRVEGQVSVMENEVTGKVLFTVKAKDPDEGENGRVSFTLDKSDPFSLEYLTIDSETGKVKVINKIDCEVNFTPLTNLDIIVTAMDHGKPSRSTDLKLSVQVQDVNDNIPIFRTHPLEFTIIENSPQYTYIGEIEIHDRDHSNKVNLRIINSNQISLPFIITTKDNKIFLINSTKSIDREKDAMFKFQVVATDGNDRYSHSVTETVEVKVIDVNDNPPMIIFPTQNNASVHRMSYKEPANHKFILVSANDYDQPPDNSRLEYMVEDDSKIFGITNEDKYIITQKDMTKADIGDHVIRIIVRDCGYPRLETSVTINIVIDQSSPKSLLCQNNFCYNTDSEKRVTANPIYENFDIILSVVIFVIIFVVIIVILIFVYVFRRCKKDDSRFTQSVFPCCQSLTSSPTVTKSMISGPASKLNFQDEQQLYNNHQLTMMNNERLLEKNTFDEQWNLEKNRVPSYNLVTNPYVSCKPTYTKLSNSPQFCFNPQPLQHVYQTIGGAQLTGQRQVDLNMNRIPSYQSRSKNGEHCKSELNLNRWDSLENDGNVFFPSNNIPGAPWILSQTPLPTRSRNLVSVSLDKEEENSFAVAFPQDQSTFV